MATFVRHTSCPICGSSDALAHYSDGSSFCFSHGKPLHNSDRPGFVVDNEEEPDFVLPDDLSTDSFPVEVFRWLEPTSVTIGELLAHNYFFSKSTGRLWRTFSQNESPNLSSTLWGRRNAAESRAIYETTGGPKARFYGSKEDTFAYSGGENLQLRNALVIVEDSLSSIKVGRSLCSLPLFGSSISNSKLVKAIAPSGVPVEHVYVWLDSDKLRNAHSISERIKLLGINSSVINTELDPKYIPDERIKCLIS